MGEVSLNHDEEHDALGRDQESGGEGFPSRGVRGGDGGSDSSALDASSLGEVAEPAGVEIDETGEEVFSRVVSLEATHVGPLPTPAMLQQYDDVVPGAATGIVEAYLEEQKARVEQIRTQNDAVDRVTRAESSAVKVGTYATAGLSIGGTIVGIVLIFMGNTLAGVIIGALPYLLTGIAKVVSAAKGSSSEDR